ncbi:MAG: right-handed parallel beta-helix repeat-containing protein [Sandaracinus sp.]
MRHDPRTTLDRPASHGVQARAGMHAVHVAPTTHVVRGMPPLRSAARLAAAIPAAVVMLAAGSARADDLWVATDGVDAADRGSTDRPLATLQAAADRVNPGDVVHVRDGAYVGFDLRRGGTEGAPVTFVAEGSAVHIDRPGPAGRGFNVEGVEYVVIEGFEVSGATAAGARCAESRFVTFRRIVSHDNGTGGTYTGIFSGCCGDMVIEDSTSYGNTEHGIYFSNSGDDSRISGNHCYDNRGGGIQVNPDLSIECTAVTTDGISSRLVIERNRLHGNGTAGGAGLNLMGLEDAVVANNLVYGNHAGGLTLYQGEAAAAPVRTLVINNTIVMPEDGRWAINIRDGAHDIVLRNNIVVTAHAFRGLVNLAGATATGDHNLYWPMGARFSAMDEESPVDLAAWTTMGQESDSAYADPATLFVDPATGDFDLLASASAAIDHGSADRAPSSDFEGRARPAGAGVDIGAYESGAAPGMDAGSVPGMDAGAFRDAEVPHDDVDLPTTDASSRSDAGAGGGGGGCGCVVAGTTDRAHLALWASSMLGLALARRRRRRT